MNIPHRVQPGSGSFDLPLRHPTPSKPWHRRISLKPFIASVLLLWATILGPAVVAEGQASENLSNLSLEDLMNIEVTTVARRPQPLSEAAAAAYVITSDEIRRSGATSVPDALRMVPGLQVAKLDANKWAISARGFNGRVSNKLLVLIDGRTVYTPLFSGVYWDTQDILLEDVYRIEVIRGPGATLWGTNAVNGVINIITKPASESQGVLVSAGGGTEERGFVSARYGGSDANLAYRVYTQYFERDAGVMVAGGPAFDDRHLTKGGFRLDWDGGAADSITFQGDIYSGMSNQMVTVPTVVPPFGEVSDSDIDTSGGNLMARWRRLFSSSSMDLQFYYDRTERSEVLLAREDRNTFDVDFQHQVSIGDSQELVWGLGFRSTADSLTATRVAMLDPSERTVTYLSGFVQHDFPLSSTTRLTLGTKVEYNSFTENEIQPNARFLWKPNPEMSAWFAVSRAVRVPSRGERDMVLLRAGFLPGDPVNPSVFPTLVTIAGSQDYESENLIAYEGGWRYQFGEVASLDFAGFYNSYDDLFTSEPLAPVFGLTPAPHLTIPSVVGNLSDGETYGFEGVAEIRPLQRWRIQGTYSYLHMNLDLKPGSGSFVTPPLFEGMNPKHQVSVRSSIDLQDDLELDLNFRWVDSLPSIQGADYFSGGARLGWRPVPNVELSIVGNDLLAPQHSEFAPVFLDTQSDVERSVYGKVTLEF